VFTHDAFLRARRPLLALTVALPLALVGGLFSPAAAAEPETWEPAPDVSLLEFLVVLLLIPVALALVITLLTVLPSMARGERGYQPGQTWRGESEWFGGPTKGVKAADEVTAEQIEARSKDTGGTSARW
jgi:hypothetical protein